ncbi:MAG: Flp family type IVb pilin [Anaerolineae bacterium]
MTDPFWWSLLRSFVGRDEGESLLEYALVIILVSLVVVVVLTLVREQINQAFQIIFG